MSAITPPVGFNLFVIQALAGKDLLEVSRAAIPFFLLLVAGVVVLLTFPDIATYLPELMSRRMR